MSAAQHMRLQTYARPVAYTNIGILYKMAMQDIRSLTVDPFICDVFNGKGRPTERNWSVWLYSYLGIVRVRWNRSSPIWLTAEKKPTYRAYTEA